MFFRIIYGLSYFIIIFSFHQENIRMMAFNFSVNAQKSEQPIHIQSSLRKSAKTSGAALEWSAFAALSPSCIRALNSASVISARTSGSEMSCCFSTPSVKSLMVFSARAVTFAVLISKTNRPLFVSSIYEHAQKCNQFCSFESNIFSLKSSLRTQYVFYTYSSHLQI